MKQLTILIFVLIPFFTFCNDDIILERVVIPNGKIRLDGLLVLPKTSTPKAAIIFLGGSGEWEIVDSYLKNPQESYGNLLKYYAGKLENTAILYLNKRGMGKSTGKWRSIGIEERADDALAAFEFLKKHPQIDPKKIGMIGHSQGGWVAQLAASRNAEVAFAIAFAGPSMGVYDQTILNDSLNFRCEGLSDEALQQKMRKRKRELGLGKAIGGIIGGEAGHWRKMADYSHDAALKNIKVPTLFIFGENDIIVPPKENLAYLQQLFPNGIPSNIETYVQSKMDHHMYEVDAPCEPLPWTVQDKKYQYSETLRHYLTDWISRRMAVL